MAITTYAELQTEISNWTVGQVTTTQAQTFIALAEAEMSRVLYPNAEERRAQADTEADQARLALPSDCRKVRTLRHVDTPTGGLDFLSPAAFDRVATTTSGRPTVYSVEANALRLSPTPDAAYTLEIIYQQGVTALSDSATSNDLLAKHPDLYLWGSLMHAFDFLMDEPRASKARGRFGELGQEVYLEGERTRFAGPLRPQSAYREIG